MTITGSSFAPGRWQGPDRASLALVLPAAPCIGLLVSLSTLPRPYWTLVCCFFFFGGGEVGLSLFDLYCSLQFQGLVAALADDE